MRSLFVSTLLILLLSSSFSFAEVSKEKNPQSDTVGISSNESVAPKASAQSMKFISIPFAFGNMIEMAEDASAENPLWVRLKLGIQYDDNVVMVSKGAPLPPTVSQKHDSRLIANLNAKYMFHKSQRFETAATYAMFQSLHSDLDDFDVTQNMAEFWGMYSISPAIDLKAIYTYHHMQLGGDTFDYAHMVGPRIIVKESASLVTHIDYRYRDTDYQNLSLFAYNSERTGENQLVGITQYIVFPTPAMLRIGFSNDEESTRRNYLDSTGNKALLGFSFMPSEKFLLDFYWEYNERDYKGISPYTSVKREDTTSVMAFTLTHYTTDMHGMNLRIYYMQNDSNLVQYDVTRFVPSLMMDMRF